MWQNEPSDPLWILLAGVAVAIAVVIGLRRRRPNFARVAVASRSTTATAG